MILLRVLRGLQLVSTHVLDPAGALACPSCAQLHGPNWIYFTVSRPEQQAVLFLAICCNTAASR